MSLQFAIPSIETERLVLRAWGNDLLDQIAELYCDEENTRFIGGVLDREDSWRRMALFVGHWALRGFGLFALTDKQSGLFAGYCGPYFPEGWPEPEIGWALAKPFQGRGLATEAALAARTFAYRTLRWTTAVSYIRPDNLPSQRVAERIGARPEKTIPFRGKDALVWRHPAPDFATT